MSSLTSLEKRKIEDLFGMASGYVLDFSNRTFAEFFQDSLNIDIYSGRYSGNGESKARLLRAFWDIEPDDLVSKALDGMLEIWRYDNLGKEEPKATALAKECHIVVDRLNANVSDGALNHMKNVAVTFDAKHLAEQVQRMEKAIDSDPALALGTAKELIETCCRTILSERGKPVTGTPDVPTLTKAVMKELKLLPDSVSKQAKGSEIIKRMLSNLGSICQCMAELRNLYGTGHGKDGKAESIKPRHARLAVGAATALATFLFATHEEGRV